MLIPSHRHRPDDLELWRELERADGSHAKTDSFARRVSQAELAIKQFARRSCYVGVSGGKDSVVVAHLASRLKLPLVHIEVCPWNNPETPDVITACEQRLGRPIVRYMADYSGITGTQLEIDAERDRVFFAVCRQIEGDIAPRRILGVRGDESRQRMLRMRRFGVSTDNACAPIGWWKVRDVFAYLSAHELPVHSAYAMLGGGLWNRERIRVDEIGYGAGRHTGRAEWEREYYGDVLRRLDATAARRA